MFEVDELAVWDDDLVDRTFVVLEHPIDTDLLRDFFDTSA